MPLIPRLYLSMLRLAKRIDDNPSYKSFIPSIRGVYYERMSSQWIPLDNTASTVLNSFGKQKPLDDVTLLAFREMTRLYTCNGMFYHPDKLSSPGSHSITTQVKKNFRHSFNASLDQSKRIDLAFLALRYLSRCVNVASKLTSSSSSSNLVGGSENLARTLVPSFQLKVGSMLVSHPLLYEKDSSLTQSCVLIVKHNEMLGSLGVVVNSPLHCTLGDRLSPDAMENNPYLQCFLGCELYAGGDVIADHPVALLHIKPLSLESQQVTNDDDNSVSNGNTAVDPATNTSTSPSSSANKSTTKRRRSSKNSASHRRSNNDSSIEITFPQSVSSSSSISSSSAAAPSSLYFTSDLMWAARDIESGHTSASDFKVIVGYAGWGVHQLQGECDMHSWFIAEGNAIRDIAMARTPYGSHQHRTNSNDTTSPTTQSNLNAPNPTTQSNLTSPSQTIPPSSLRPTSSLQINNGHNLWQNSLLQMGGEFASFSRIIDYNRRDQVDLEREGESSQSTHRSGGKDKDAVEKDNESIDKVMDELYQLSLYGVDIDIE